MMNAADEILLGEIAFVRAIRKAVGRVLVDEY